LPVPPALSGGHAAVPGTGRAVAPGGTRPAGRLRPRGAGGRMTLPVTQDRRFAMKSAVSLHLSTRNSDLDGVPARVEGSEDVGRLIGAASCGGPRSDAAPVFKIAVSGRKVKSHCGLLPETAILRNGLPGGKPYLLTAGDGRHVRSHDHVELVSPAQPQVNGIMEPGWPPVTQRRDRGRTGRATSPPSPSEGAAMTERTISSAPRECVAERSEAIA
jgi:hypothetical protein